MTISQRPYGSWSTPISSELLVSAAVTLSGLHSDGPDTLWAEGRPAEGGRTQLVRRTPDGATTDLLPDGFNARTGVHEYGGAAWWTREGVIWFTNWTDQRLYRLSPDGTPEPLTAEPAVPRGDRFADGTVSPDGTTIACVRERHTASGAAADVRNEIVRLAAHAPSEPEVLATGPDFVAAPRWSPDGSTLAYLRWNHPSMPWDSTELVTLDLASGTETVVAGGEGESVAEPRWGADGALWFLSDRSGWWNLYRARSGSDVEPMVLMDAEIGVPAWVLGSARYALLPDGRVVFARQSNGYDTLLVRGTDGTLTELDLPYSYYSSVAPDPGSDSVLVVAGSPTSELEAARVLLGTEPVVTSLRPPRDLAALGGLDQSYLSAPEHVSFPSTWPDGSPRTAHALFYPPANPGHHAPDGELPPLLVVIHGGPTAAAVPVLQLGLQYWTSRGFAVVDVNYGGSTGYGRAYREQLLGNWGLIDVADCVAAARWLAEDNRVDPARLCIRGGSAGGYTTLAALVLDDTPFAAGADHYGVSDLEALAADTHKFESRYLDRLIGPYPEARDVYVERSPLTHVDRFRTPLIVLQGSEDRVVPPNQSSMIVDALRAKGVPVAYLLFEGEEHGFRRAENIRRACDGELSFYSQIFNFPVEGIPPVHVSGKGVYPGGAPKA
ncbi:S9 family peptidase [Pseudonocardia spinosispora]|uniref:S9 family peptidase n=1 Tax=Pseudonocardia spinosispora TaxID=103441 RepID=UPI000415B0B1|nr:S9 family peptidase [Pseudonocardia spinosispora]